MKVYEIISESQVSEGPASLIGQGLKRIGSGIAGALGAKHLAGRLGGSADVGARANALEGEFQRYLARIGKNTKTADFRDLSAFLQANKLPVIQGQGLLSQQNVDAIFMKIAQSSFRASDVVGTSSSPQYVSKPSASVPVSPVTNTVQAGQEVAYDGKTYRFMGKQWAELSPISKKPARIARKEVVPHLNQLAASSPAPKQTAVDYNQPAYRRRGVAEPVTEPVKKNSRGQRIDTRGRFTRKPSNI